MTENFFNGVWPQNCMEFFQPYYKKKSSFSIISFGNYLLAFEPDERIVHVLHIVGGSQCITQRRADQPDRVFVKTHCELRDTYIREGGHVPH